MQQLALDLSQPPPPSLDNFAPGRNSEALAVLNAWLSDGVEERCIYLWGQPGCGKTHLLRAAVAFALDRQAEAAYVSATRVADLEGASELPALLALDDAQQLDAAGQAFLFRAFQRMRERPMRLLAAGDATPGALALREDVRSRLAAGLVFRVQLLSDAEKAEALASHARARGFTVGPEVAEYLLRHGRRDLPSLMAVLDAVDRYSLEAKRPVTLPLLREVLQSAGAGKPARPT